MTVIDVAVYTKPACVQCEQTTKLLDKEGIGYTAQPMNDEIMAEAAERGVRSAPIVVAGTRMWGGFSPDKIRSLK